MLSSTEYRAFDAVGLAALINSKELSAVEALNCALREIERLNPFLNAVVMRNDSQAIKAAKAVDTSLPLAGVPFLAKDINVHVKHFRTTHACRFFADSEVQREDSILVKRWRDAGLIIPARTNTPEFATDFGCEPELYGPTLNPWNMALTPGGSSGGAAAAVASGMVPMAHATDSGGSIRAPAACCGVFGFKPTGGLVATGSPLGPLVNGLNSDHVVSRSVRDSAAMLDATIGAEPASPMLHANRTSSYLAALNTPLARLRIGITDLSPTGLKPTAEISCKLDDTATLLKSLGHEILPWTWPADADPCDTASIFWMAELAALIDQRSHELGRGPSDQELGPLVYKSWKKAHSINSVAVVNARVRLRQIQMNMAKATANIDVLLTPVLSESPLPSGMLSELVNNDIDHWMERAWQFAPYLEVFNVTGQPAMSVPLHVGDDGMPIGLHFVGQVGDDALLLKLAHELERNSRWSERPLPDIE